MLGKGMQVYPVEVGNHSRFVPNMMPILPCGAGKLVGALKFPETTHHDFHFVGLLGQSEVFAEPFYRADQYTEVLYEEDDKPGPDVADFSAPMPEEVLTDEERAEVEKEDPPPPTVQEDMMDPEDVAGQLKEFVAGVSPEGMRGASEAPIPYMNTASSLSAARLAFFDVSKLRAIPDPVVALERVRTLNYAIRVLMPHAGTHLAGRMDELRAAAASLTLDLRRKVEMPTRWRDNMEAPEAAVAAGVDAAATADAQVPAAVDDPVGERTTVEDFGEGTSKQGSIPGAHAAPDAEPPSTEILSIGFAPPQGLPGSTPQ